MSDDRGVLVGEGGFAEGRGAFCELGGGGLDTRVDGTDDSDVLFQELEVLDSEEDEKDPFREFRRAQTEPLRKAGRVSDVKERAATAAMQRSKRSDLMEILLPDNVDSSILAADFSAVQWSTQMTDLTSALDSESAMLEHIDEDNLGSSAHIHAVILKKDDDAKEDIQPDEQMGEPPSFLVTLPIPRIKPVRRPPVSDPVISDALEQDIGCLGAHGATDANKLHELGSLPQPHPKESSPSHDNDTANEPLSRPTKRKSTLSELCSRKSKVPYRVGLSKRANIQHLHSYLKK
jgi:hypothetical protein